MNIIIPTIFEVLLTAAVILGGIYEEKLADFEQKIYKTWRNKK
jgi:hypothetical protein